MRELERSARVNHGDQFVMPRRPDVRVNATDACRVGCLSQPEHSPVSPNSDSVVVAAGSTLDGCQVLYIPPAHSHRLSW